MKPLLFALSCTMLMNMADAHQAVSSGELKPAVLLGAKEYQLHSNFTNKDYRIQVLPVGNVKELGYSVLYVLDGDALFPAAAGMAKNMMARAEETNAVPFLIVGIGYPNTLLLNPKERSQDYTPPSENYENTGDKVNRQFGGAEHFYRFIQEELFTDRAQRFHINKSQQNILACIVCSITLKVFAITLSPVPPFGGINNVFCRTCRASSNNVQNRPNNISVYVSALENTNKNWRLT